MPKEITMKDALAALRRQESISIPETGRVLADIGKNASYAAAEDGTLGVTVFEVGGGKRPRKRVPSIEVRRLLGMADDGSQAASGIHRKPAPQPALRPAPRPAPRPALMPPKEDRHRRSRGHHDVT
jgi:hypothetical protein